MKEINKVSWFDSFRMFISELTYKYPTESNFFVFAEKLAKKVSGLKVVDAHSEIIKFFGQGVSERDNHYYAVPEKLLLDFYKIYPSPKYKLEQSDCDNFSLDFMAFLSRFNNMIPGAKYSFALGMLAGYFDWAAGHHQVNFFVTEKGVRIFEPQTGKIYDSFKSVTMLYL